MKIFNLIETTIAKQTETKFVIASSGLKNCVEYLTIIEFFVKKKHIHLVDRIGKA